MRSIIVMCIIGLACPAWGGLPLITDDPGTVAPGGIQLEQSVDFNEARGFTTSSTTFTYGVSSNFDAGIATGYNFDGNTGVTTPNLCLKWRFFGNPDSGLSFALSTISLLSNRSMTSEQTALVLGQYQTGNSTFLINLGRSWMSDEPNPFDWCLAYECNTSPYTTLVMETTNTDFIASIPGPNNVLEYLVGAIYTDHREYAYSAGVGYLPDEDVSSWRLTAGITITF